MTDSEKIAHLQNILSRTESACRTADLDGLAVLTAELQEVMQRLQAPLPPKAMHALAAQAAQVAGHIDAARRGVQSARRRVKDIRAAFELRTYDQQGQARNLAPAPVPTQRRF